MKTKILALIGCIIMSGTVGAIVNNSNIKAEASGNCIASTAATQLAKENPASSNSSDTKKAEKFEEVTTCPKSTSQTNETKCKVDPITVKPCTSSVCPQNSAVEESVHKEAQQNQNSLNCVSGCKSSYICEILGNCINSANCKTKVDCFVNSNGCAGKTGTYCANTKTTNKSAPKASTTSANNTVSVPQKGVPTGTQSTGTNFAVFQNEVVQIVNKERAANGLAPLTVNAQVTKSATLKSEDMAKLNYFSHTSPTYGSPFDMMKQFGISYRSAGENIAKGQATPQQVMQGWMNSPGHRANILNSSFTQIGVGIAKNSQGQLIWTQQFIG